VSGLFHWGARKGGGSSAASAATIQPPSVQETFASSKVLPKFLSTLSHKTAPVLLDLGPVVGANVAFFGDRLACKIQILDFYTDVEACGKKGEPSATWRAFEKRLSSLAAESFDGILCWDVFDYLDRTTAQALAARLAALLRPGGVLYGFFGTTPVDLTSYTRFIVEDAATYKQRSSPATLVRRTPLVNRDLTRMFDPLTVAESVLLKTCTRETLFRKATA
jgi:hypothetical protein